MSEAKALLRLQELDLEYSHLKHEAETLDQKQQLIEVKAKAKKVASELKTIVTERKDIEIELEDNAVHKKYLTDKVSELQNTEGASFRETQDLDHSLSSLAKKLEKVDFDTDKLLERHSVVERAEKNARDIQRDLLEQEQDITLSYKLALERIAKRVQQSKFERAEIAKELPEETLARYEADRKKFGGIAIETLNGNRPTACRVALKEGNYNELIRKKQEINLCPYCKRMLIIPQD